jgi:hypothetical protein
MLLDKSETARKHVGVLGRGSNADWDDALNALTRTNRINPSLHLMNVATKCSYPVWCNITDKKSRRAVANDNP